MKAKPSINLNMDGLRRGYRWRIQLGMPAAGWPKLIISSAAASHGGGLS
jgi:hypothetical protein